MSVMLSVTIMMLKGYLASILQDVTLLDYVIVIG